jgi:hypothetical protein
LVAGVTLTALAVGVCAAFDVFALQTHGRPWCRRLVASGLLETTGLVVLAAGSLSLFAEGPVVFVPSLAPMLACIGLSLLSGRGVGPQAVAAAAVA